MIYDPVLGDLDSGIAPGTPFEAIPDDWNCPICDAVKRSFIPYAEPITA
jgi:rubredoxin